jgi:hypothetical protein
MRDRAPRLRQGASKQRLFPAGKRGPLRCQFVALVADRAPVRCRHSTTSTLGAYDGSMRFKRYLAVMGATSVTAAALVAGFNLLVDPLGISPIRIAIAGFNEWKPLRQDYDRIVKPSGVIIRERFSLARRESSKPSIPSCSRALGLPQPTMRGSMVARTTRSLIHIFNTTPEQTKNCVTCSSRRSHRRCFQPNRARAWGRL